MVNPDERTSLESGDDRATPGEDRSANEGIPSEDVSAIGDAGRDELKPASSEEAGERTTEDAQERMEPEGDGLPPQVAGLDGLRAEVQGGFQRVLDAFEHKLAYDRTKDHMVDRLHGELQAYKADLLAGATLPLVSGLIRLHDELGRVVEALLEEDESSIDAGRVVKLLQGFQGDVEIVLGDNGVSRYEESEESFDPRRQQVLQTVPTRVAADVGLVVERVRPGFERGDRIIRKEKVKVTKLSEPAEVSSSGGTSEVMEEEP